jgi:cell division septal protein FtsQ
VEARSRARPSAVRVRGPTRTRPRAPTVRGPGLPERLLRPLRSPAFWGWCLAKLGALAVLAAASFVLYQIATSTTFYASDVTVDGISLLGTQEVLDAASVSGVHILWVNSRQAAQRIRLLPAVEQVTVQPLFPRRVTIQVVERKPVAQWQVGNFNFLVDEEGRVIGSAPRGEGLPQVRETRSGTLQVGDTVPPESVRVAVELSELLPTAWRPVSGAFDYAPDTGISVSTRQGWRVRFGDADDLPLKVATLQALAAEIERSGARVQVVDVRFPGRPYYR